MEASPLTLTQDDWLTLIQNPLTEREFAGTELVVPSAGNKVRVVRGKYLDTIFTVVAVRGNVYRLDQRIYVDHPSGKLTWYHPWDLEVL